jgi:hypothetical protein
MDLRVCTLKGVIWAANVNVGEKSGIKESGVRMMRDQIKVDE